jgi:hypothetical protein
MKTTHKTLEGKKSNVKRRSAKLLEFILIFILFYLPIELSLPP